MIALTTHDTKRGEDVRARIGVLSQVPSLWAELVGEWERRLPPPDPMTGLFLLQNIFGVWPVDGAVTDDLRGSACTRYAEKAIREAAVHTIWNDPDNEFEAGVHAWLDAVMDGPVATELTSLVARLDDHARNDALGQKLMAADRTRRARCLSGHRTVGRQPRRPRQPPTGRLTARREALAALERRPKIRVVAAALRLRRDRPDAFLDGAYYRPLLAAGPAAEHLVAFVRGSTTC